MWSMFVSVKSINQTYKDRKIWIDWRRYIDADMVEGLDTMSSVKLGGFQSLLEESCMSSHTEELWYNETVYLVYDNIYGLPLA